MGETVTLISTPMVRRLLRLVGVSDQHSSRPHHVTKPELIL